MKTAIFITIIFVISILSNYLNYRTALVSAFNGYSYAYVYFYIQTIPCRLINEKKHFECSRVCNKKLTCGRHRCSNKCCVRAEHSCDRVCGKRLQCGRHFCQDSCHSGHCERCWEISKCTL